MIEKYEREGSPYYSTARLWGRWHSRPDPDSRRASACAGRRLQRADPKTDVRRLQDIARTPPVSPTAATTVEYNEGLPCGPR